MKFRRKLKPKTGIDLTAMLDVVFNLLIFFMVSTTMINNPLIRVDLPKSASEDKQTQEYITIAITEEGDYYLGQDPMTPEALRRELDSLARTRNVEDPVVIRPDKRIPVERLVDAMNMANNAGFVRVSIATESE